MLQEDSNGENSFEIIEKKTGDLSIKSEITDSLSSISSAYSIPSPVVSSMVNAGSTGNLLSNVAPPTSLPDFTIWPSPTTSNVTSSVTTQPQPSTLDMKPIPSASSQFPTTQFSAAIPPSKGIRTISQPIEGNQGESGGGGFMGLVKEAFSSGGVLSKMAEKAKSSVDSIITTLDPQMSEYIYSSGDTEVTVTSEVEEEVAAVREAFHSVFGKAWINGIKLNMPVKTSVAIGFEEGWKNASEKIDYSLKYRNTPTISIENILFQEKNDWYDVNLLLLRDVERQITVKTFSQATPLPLDQILSEIDSEGSQYKDMELPQKLAVHLKNKPGWEQNITGFNKKEVLVLAAKTLIRVYKSHLPISNN
ncbi:protein PRRC1-like isoform X2 [Aethina tumida]|uniref:protein PRRC1-like isoform X2 n=1 Tax=Aethina tumida TaxID=116153 RepID=UPI00096B286E|nr:protein PRRC1-like isoform X2 [Aethina tumida]